MRANHKEKNCFCTISSSTHEISDSEASFDAHHQLCNIATLVQIQPKIQLTFSQANRVLYIINHFVRGANKLSNVYIFLRANRCHLRPKDSKLIVQIQQYKNNVAAFFAVACFDKHFHEHSTGSEAVLDLWHH